MKIGIQILLGDVDYGAYSELNIELSELLVPVKNISILSRWRNYRRKKYLIRLLTTLVETSVYIFHRELNKPASCPHGYWDWDRCPDCCH